MAYIAKVMPVWASCHTATIGPTDTRDECARLVAAWLAQHGRPVGSIHIERVDESEERTGER